MEGMLFLVLAAYVGFGFLLGDKIANFRGGLIGILLGVLWSVLFFLVFPEMDNKDLHPIPGGFFAVTYFGIPVVSGGFGALLGIKIKAGRALTIILSFIGIFSGACVFLFLAFAMI